MRSRFGVAAVLTATVLVAATCAADSSGTDPSDATAPAPAPVPQATGGPPAPPGPEAPAPAPGVEPVHVGVIMATTGRLAPRDGPVLDVLQYAVRQVNASGGLQGRPLEIVYEDSRSELNGAYQAARRLVTRDVAVIFTTCDPYFSRPILEEAGRANVLVITPCGPEPRQAGVGVRALTFAAGTPAADYGRVMAEHAADAGVRSVATLVESDSDEATQICAAFEARFGELGGSVGFSFRFDRHWIAAQPVVGEEATALALSPVSGYPMAVICAAVGGSGADFFGLLRSAGVTTSVLAPPALDGAALRYGIAGHEPLVVVTESSTYGDDPSNQVNAYFASVITGDLRRGRDDVAEGADEEGADEVGAPAEPEAVVEDRVGWAVTGAEALWIFMRAAQRTGSLDAAVLAADIERFTGVDLWMDSATFGPARHVVSGRVLRVIRHDGGASRLVELRVPFRP